MVDAKQEIKPQIFHVYSTSRKSHLIYYGTSLIFLAATVFLYTYLELKIFSIIPLGLALIPFMISEILIHMSSVKIKSDGIMREEGLLSKNYSSINYDDIVRITVRQSFWGRILNYGTIYIDVSGMEGAEMEIAQVSDPLNVEQEIKRIWNQYVHKEHSLKKE